MNDNDKDAPFWEHAAELRRTLLQTLLIIAAAIAVCLWFYQNVFSILTWPLQNQPPSTTSLIHQEFKRERISNLNSKPLTHSLSSQTVNVIQTSPGTLEIKPSHYLIPPQGYIDVETLIAKNLVLLGPIDGMSITLKVCFWVGLVLSSPFWIYLLLRFAAPAIEQEDWGRVVPFIGLSLFFLGLGGGFAYFITLPIANQYLEVFNSSIGTNLWSLSHYLDFTLFLILANSLAFELSLVLFFLVHYGILSPQTLKSKRKPMMVLAFVLGALLTPPDVITQLMLALPLIGLYELAILYAYARQKAKNYLGIRT
jgi:sec-independent protein translocase protein TatC